MSETPALTSIELVGGPADGVKVEILPGKNFYTYTHTPFVGAPLTTHVYRRRGAGTLFDHVYPGAKAADNRKEELV